MNITGYFYRLFYLGLAVIGLLILTANARAQPDPNVVQASPLEASLTWVLLGLLTAYFGLMAIACWNSCGIRIETKHVRAAHPFRKAIYIPAENLLGIRYWGSGVYDLTYEDPQTGAEHRLTFVRSFRREVAHLFQHWSVEYDGIRLMQEACWRNRHTRGRSASNPLLSYLPSPPAAAASLDAPTD